MLNPSDSKNPRSKHFVYFMNVKQQIQAEYTFRYNENIYTDEFYVEF